MIKKYWRGYNCEPKWRKPEIWMDAVVFSTPRWGYAIQLPKFIVHIQFRKWMRGADDK